MCHVHALDVERINPYKAVLKLDGKPVPMEIDTGAAVSIISEQTQKSLFPTADLAEPTIRLRTYTSKPIHVVGQMSVEVQYNGYQGRHTVYVVEGKGPALMGRDWLSQITLDWASIKAVVSTESKPDISKLLDKYSEVFQPGLGTMKRIKAHLTLKPEATPRFHRPRSVPFAIKDKVGKELDRLEEAGVLQRVDHSEWAAPIVPVPKRDGSIRVCGDYKVTINPSLQIDQYPLPKPSDLMACLTGGKTFSKLDLTSAYQQMLLDEDSARLVTLNTHQGLYQCNRLPFGVASAPAVVECAMDSILQGIPYVICYLDDILVTGRSDEEHARHLEIVLSRLQEHGIRLKKEKCHFFQSSVEYLGHLIDAQGVHTSTKKYKPFLMHLHHRTLTNYDFFLDF